MRQISVERKNQVLVSVKIVDVVHESQYWVLCSVKIFYVVLEAQYQVLEVQQSTIFTIKEKMLCLMQFFLHLMNL